VSFWLPTGLWHLKGTVRFQYNILVTSDITTPVSASTFTDIADGGKEVCEGSRADLSQMGLQL
jgi:hypothetical protein